jgi:hypothetical protein
MNYGKSISPAEVDFWLDTDRYSNFIQEGLDPSNKTLVFSIDMVRLSSIRSAISNFVRILTRKSIPVYFNDADANVNFGGKVIYISAKITSKQDFDVAVGQALHEGAHTLKTDFDMVKNAWANIPHHLLKMSDAKNISRLSFEKFLHTIWNVIEDRYIDDYVFNGAPGYRGYYVALYDRFWNCPEVDEYLISDDFRYPSLKSYSFRITNFTNENTDLLALPRLDDIAQEIDITNISRLDTTMDRVKVAFRVMEIVLDCIDKQEKLKESGQGGGKQRSKRKGLADPNDYFDFGDSDEPEEKGEELTEDNDDQMGEGEPDVGKKMIKEISDVMSGKDPEPEKLKENEDAANKISDEPKEKEVAREIEKLIQSQQKFLAGELPKEQVTSSQKELLDLIEKHGITLVRVVLPTLESGNDSSLKVDCIVVHKMTRELVLSGQDIFPLSGAMQMDKETPEPPEDVANAVKKGILLGTKLGRKLQIRAEIHPVKIIRKKSGKTNRRQLHEAAFDAEDLFQKIKIENRPDANIHITVDASSSMAGNKWNKTMTAVVAICKAASMVHNIHTTVSFRTTQVSGTTQLPYIVLAYDSKVDKFSKIKALFPYLVPNGCTPEGLAFSAIMGLFEGITPDEEDRYFLNLSDGEPFFILIAPETGLAVEYRDDTGVVHTKSQVDKIRRHGVQILSYFIEEDYVGFGINPKKRDEMTKEELEEEAEREKEKDASPLRKNFRKMYGKNSKFIDVNSVVELAKTINGLFLKGKA